MLSDNTIVRNDPENIIWRSIFKARKELSTNKRERLNSYIKSQLQDIPFTIFSNNCIAGVFYHDAGRQFTTPTINLAFDGPDYISFLENPKKYLYSEMKFIDTDLVPYPVAQVHDIEIRFVHYKTEQECIEMWNKRANRIVWDNIFVIATTHDGLDRKDLLERFDRLKYKNKIMYTSDEELQYDWQVCVPQFKGRQLKILTNYSGLSGYRYYECFDIANWISSNSNRCLNEK